MNTRLVAGLCACGCLALEMEAAAPPPPTALMIPMRDGIRLATDIYLPQANAANLPCILIRTPYGRDRYPEEFGKLALANYAVAIQDLRGRFDSEGKSMAFQSDGWGEQQDGYDTVEWLARQPFCNGRVGTLGASAMGITQILMAPAAPPHLVCQYISVAPASLFHEAIYVGGVLRKNQAETYLSGQAHPDALPEAMSHPEYDQYWTAYDTVKMAGQVRIPAIHYGGWFDTFCEGTLNAFVSRQNQGGPGARGKQKLVMGPWTHGGPGKLEFGDFELPIPARKVPFDISARRWFDFHLKNQANGADQIPNVIYYVMGPFDGSPSSGNVWRTAEQWPIPVRQTSFYLGANGSLVSQPIHHAAASLSFLHNPANPVPTQGGRNLYLPAGPMDQRNVESRSDVLTFTTEPLVQDLEVTGKVIAEIYIEVPLPKAHLAARLCDVYPDGRSILIAEGIQKIEEMGTSGRGVDGWVASQSAANSSGLNQSRNQLVRVDLWSTSMVFAKGHRIRLSLAGSNYPRWEVAATSPGRKYQVTIWVADAQPSRLWLPVVEASH